MNPPRLLEKFLHWTLPNDLKDPVLGDLAEAKIQFKIINLAS